MRFRRKTFPCRLDVYCPCTESLAAGSEPKENQEIPPLSYNTVYRLKQDFPTLEIIINRGIRSINECETHLSLVDGVMIGREAYQNPWMLSQVDARLFGESPAHNNRERVIEELLPFVERELAAGVPLNRITGIFSGLFHGQPGARAWRRYLSSQSLQNGR